MQVLSVGVWVSSGFSGFLLSSKNVNKLPLGMSIYMCVCMIPCSELVLSRVYSFHAPRIVCGSTTILLSMKGLLNVSTSEVQHCRNVITNMLLQAHDHRSVNADVAIRDLLHICYHGYVRH